MEFRLLRARDWKKVVFHSAAILAGKPNIYTPVLITRP